MKKNRIIKGVLAFLLLVLVLPTPAAFAQSYISISNTSGNSLSITVSGAPYGQSIDLVYTLPGSSLQTVVSNIGSAYSGSWNGTLNLNEYGIVNGSTVFVRVGGQQSNSIIVGGYTGGCTYNCGSPYSLSLSQTTVNLSVGQSQTVTAYPSTGSGPYGNNFYISSNSNSNVVSASISGSQISLYGLANGSSTISVCVSGYSYNYSYGQTYGCASIYVTVAGSVAGASTYNVSIRDNYYSPQTITIPQGSSITWRNDGSMQHTVAFDNPYSDSGTIYSGGSYTKTFYTAGTYTFHCNFHSGMTGTVIVTSSGTGSGSVWFSPSNPTMYVAQSLAVSINSSVGASTYYSSNAYYVSSNSNPNVVSATVSGTVLNLYANQSGSSTITVCHSSLQFCGSLYVIVAGGSYGGQLTFSQSNVNLNQNQNINISIYGGTGSGNYYISNNTNPSVVNASISGSTVYLYGQAGGSSQITVCQNNAAACGTLYVTVFGSGGTGSGIWFSQSNVNLAFNQSQIITIYSSLGGNYYLSSNSNSNAASASVVGSSLNLYGRAAGSSNITVCHSTASNVCGAIFVSVGGGYGGNLSLSQNSLNLAAGQSAAVTVYNSTGSLYVSSNSSPSVAGANISGSILNVYAANPGSTTINICQNNSSQCVNLPVTVSGYSSGSLTFLATNLPSIVLGQFYSYQLQVSGGTSPYNFSLISGSLPSGLSLSATGVISGTAQSAAAASFTVRVSDNFGRTTTANFYLSGPSTGSGSSGGVLGASIYKNGQLIKEGGTVYIVYRNMKSGFANLSAFTGFGFKLSNVINVGTSGLADSGYVVSTSNASHPWGSWIKSGQTVYFVHESGLIPVPDWNTFLNNGGQGSLVVSANLYDFSLSMLPVMSFDDARLK